MLNHQFSRVPLKDRISTTEGDIQRRRRLGMSESNPELKALRVFLQSLYAERNKENRPKLVNETLYPIAPHQKTPRASVPRTTVAKPYRLKAGGRTYNVQFAKDPDEVDLDQARQKYLAKDNPAALALIKSLQQEISGLGEEAPERYQGLVDRIDWVRKEGTNPVYAEAAKIAARRLGITNPHEIQSIAWHMSKALFDAGLKRSKKRNLVEDVWQRYSVGQRTPQLTQQAREEIFRIAGGFNEMPWLKPGTSRNQSSYK